MCSSSHVPSFTQRQSANNFPFSLSNYQFPRWLFPSTKQHADDIFYLKSENKLSPHISLDFIFPFRDSIIHTFSPSTLSWTCSKWLSSPLLQRNSSHKGHQSCVYCFIQWSFIHLQLSCSIGDFFQVNHSLFLHLPLGPHILLIFFLLYVYLLSVSFFSLSGQYKKKDNWLLSLGSWYRVLKMLGIPWVIMIGISFVLMRGLLVDP